MAMLHHSTRTAVSAKKKPGGQRSASSPVLSLSANFYSVPSTPAEYLPQDFLLEMRWHLVPKNVELEKVSQGSFGP
jgi:hypothetical protein